MSLFADEKQRGAAASRGHTAGNNQAGFHGGCLSCARPPLHLPWLSRGPEIAGHRARGDNGAQPTPEQPQAGQRGSRQKRVQRGPLGVLTLPTLLLGTRQVTSLMSLGFQNCS